MAMSEYQTMDMTAGGEKMKWSYDSIIEKFKSDNLRDEIHMATTYLDMAQCMHKQADSSMVAVTDDRCQMIELMYHMAYEESTHAKFIHDCIIAAGLSIDAQLDADYRDMEKRFKHLFRGYQYFD